PSRNHENSLCPRGFMVGSLCGGFVAAGLAAESLLSLAASVTSEHRIEPVLRKIVEGLASQPGVALSRIWLLPSVPSSSQQPPDSPEDVGCLRLVASAG